MTSVLRTLIKYFVLYYMGSKYMSDGVKCLIFGAHKVLNSRKWVKLSILWVWNPQINELL